MEFQFEAALERLAPHIRETPLLAVGRGRYLKAENRQLTGSFKLRGALNKLLKLEERAVANGVLAASAGNHGLGVAYAARQIGARCTIVVPQGAVQRKVDGMAELGAEVLFAPGGYGAAERLALEMRASSASVWVSPYNDFDVVEGQGTLGIEIAGELGSLHSGVLYVPVSGGGLACGVGMAIKASCPGWRIIGVQTESAPYMSEHFAGRDMSAITERETIADGLAGPVQDGSATLKWILGAVDDIQTVGEDEILASMARVYAEIGDEIEPSAAVGMAAWERTPTRGPVIIILSGGNVDPETMKLALQR